jgi:hypothetical protein
MLVCAMSSVWLLARRVRLSINLERDDQLHQKSLSEMVIEFTTKTSHTAKKRNYNDL